MKQNETPVKG